jgi:hypothetical protein
MTNLISPSPSNHFHNQVPEQTKDGLAKSYSVDIASEKIRLSLNKIC